MKRKPYVPTEVHLGLYPPRDMRLCACGVRFEARPAGTGDEDDDPGKCLSCNRSGWSRLFPKPEAPAPKTEEVIDLELERHRRAARN